MSGHVLLVAPPFAGHLHPVLGIGVELARRGVPVRVASTAAARPRIEAAGLEAVVLGSADGSLDALVAAVGDPVERVGRDPLRLHRQFRATLAILGTIRDELDELVAADPPAVVVADFTLPVAGGVAVRHGARWFTAIPSPAALGANDGPPGYCGGLLPPASTLERVRDAVARSTVRGFKRAVFALNARPLRELGFTGAFRPDGSEQAYSPDTVLALALQELELPRSWPAAVRFVGPVRYSPPGRPDAWGAVEGERGGADASVHDSRPRVLVTLGTHLAAEKAELPRLLTTLAELLPEVRLELTLGGSAPPDAMPAATAAPFAVVDYVDYDRLDRYAAVVHHGGTGIAQATLAAARPAVVVPIDYDQPDVAARLVHHDLAERLDARVLHPGRTGAEALAGAVRRALDPPAARLAALERFAEASARELGAVGAADLIETALQTTRPHGRARGDHR
ncbi:glycosyltransferase [Agromyces sp. NPDC058136]|uniref:glycosyltransferase n=1 Tax=Agromyces sp. NPDC058136 TaxID=3346354 RepID=UPI0036D814F2